MDRDTRRGSRRWRLRLAVVAIGAGCAGDTAPDRGTAPATTVRDSAGVRIVDSRDSAWTSPGAWWIEPLPTLEIGSPLGDRPGTDFGRVVGVVRFPDGRIAVADALALQIRMFSDSGAFLGAWARIGSGPGELERVDALAIAPGDSLVISNTGILRHEVFGPNGRYARTVRLPPPSWLPRGVQTFAWLPGGDVIVGPSRPDPRAPRPGTGADTNGFGDMARDDRLAVAEWHRFDATGERANRVAVLPAQRIERHGPDDIAFPVIYGPRAHAAASWSGVWTGYPETFELRHIGRAGVDIVLRRAWQQESVPARLVDAYTEWYGTAARVAGLPETALPDYVERRRAEALVERTRGNTPPLSFAATLPAFIAVVAPRDGGVWVQQHATTGELLAAAPYAVATNRWTVFDLDGRWLGTVTAPNGLRLTEVGADYVLGVWRDELDVEYVRLHRLIKP
jgi:hypothetical protein